MSPNHYTLDIRDIHYALDIREFSLSSASFQKPQEYCIFSILQPYLFSIFYICFPCFQLCHSSLTPLTFQKFQLPFHFSTIYLQVSYITLLNHDSSICEGANNV